MIHRKIATLFGAYADTSHIMDGFPLPVCHWARAKRCTTFRDVSALGDCASKDAYSWGLHGSVIISMTGAITGITATMATGDVRVALYEVVEDITGLLIGDKGSISKRLQADLLHDHAIDLQTPLRSNMREPRHPAFVHQLMTTRR